MKNPKKVYMFGVAGLFVAYFGYQVFTRTHDASQVAEDTVKEAVPTVAVTSAKPVDPSSTITLPGNIEAWYQAPIYAQVAGYVTSWFTDYGAEVKKGDVLAQINAPMVSAQYDQAVADMKAQEAKYQIADLTAKRYTAMSESNAVPIQTISVKQADARVEQAKLAAAQQHVKNLDAQMVFRTIVAPYDGVVTSRGINVGDYVNKEGDLSGNSESSALFRVADIHKMRLFVSVPESFGDLMKPGQTADVVLPQYPTRHYTAQFLTVAKGFTTETRTAVTEFTIDNADHSIWPGSFASVTLTASSQAQTFIIPATALVFDENGTQVALVTKDNKVHFQHIVVNSVLDSAIGVTSGITASDKIIDNPSGYLLEGDEVRIVTPAPGLAITER